MRRIPVGILGATGHVGQQYVNLLANHPWFEVTFLAASEASAGKSFREATAGRSHCSSALQDSPVHHVENIAQAQKACRFVFSAMSNEGARAYEEQYAAAGIPVISNASCHRSADDVPMLIPEVNPEHSQIIPIQQRNRGWERGFIAVKPNCSLQSYMIPLFPLHRAYKVTRLIITTLQAVSGAGYPGVSSLDMVDNVVPFISKEEEKSEQEPLKLLGHIEGNRIRNAEAIAISAHCNRVPVLDGHLVCVSVSFEHTPTLEEMREAWHRFPGLQLPSAPSQPIVYREEDSRPQPRLDRMEGNGMAVTVGRLRECPVLDYRFVALSHNTIRGAAGGGILNAELLVQQGFLEVPQ